MLQLNFLDLNLFSYEVNSFHCILNVVSNVHKKFIRNQVTNLSENGVLFFKILLFIFNYMHFLVRVLLVLKYRDQKQLREERVYLTHRLQSFIRAIQGRGTLRQKLKQKPSRSVAYWLAQFTFLNLPGPPSLGWHYPE